MHGVFGSPCMLIHSKISRLLALMQLQRNMSLSHSRMKIHVWRYNGAYNNLYQQKNNQSVNYI